jgi:hypothetical protein
MVNQNAADMMHTSQRLILLYPTARKNETNKM